VTCTKPLFASAKEEFKKKMKKEEEKKKKKECVNPYFGKG
jgi:hypothetical protein